MEWAKFHLKVHLQSLAPLDLIFIMCFSLGFSLFSEENSNVSESTSNQPTAQSGEKSQFVQSERHMSVPVLQNESKENRHQNRVIQEVSFKELSSHSSRETSQSSKYQVRTDKTGPSNQPGDHQSSAS